jgi:hypothetical protein
MKPSELPPIDRSKWGPGPWDGEPDRVEFKTAAGFTALIQRVQRGHLCGYVAVPHTHPFYASGDDRLKYKLEVHGDVTYAKACAGHVCHVPAPGESDDVWWIGFDANHRDDSSPLGGDPGFFGFLDDDGDDFASKGPDDYRTVEYMRAECEKLAEQLKAAT